MSIINKLLQDIEKNTPGGKPPETPNVQLELGTSFNNKYRQKFVNRFTIIGLIVLILAIIIFASHHFHTNKITKGAPPPKQATATTAATNQQPNPKANVISVSICKETKVKLTNVAINLDNNKTIVNFDLDQTTYYYVERNKDPLQLKLILSNTTYDNEFSLKFDHTAIKNMAFHKVNCNVEIDIELLPDSQIIGLQLYNQPKSLLQLTLLNTSVPLGTVSKKAIPLSPAELADQDYKDALDLLNKNKIDLAINKLRNTVKSSENPDSYELLATLLIKSNAYNEATKVLNFAITKFPNHANFYRSKAYILMQQGNDTRALEVLLENPPEITQNPDYYVLIATIYQQQKQFLLAAKLYNRLVQIYPEHSIWWVGLGIALESAGKENAAQEAYLKAQSSGNLPPDVRNFLDTKIKR